MATKPPTRSSSSDFAAIVDGDWTSDVPIDQIPAVIGQLAALQLRLTARQLEAQKERADKTASGDTLLRVGEAATALGTSTD